MNACRPLMAWILGAVLLLAPSASGPQGQSPPTALPGQTATLLPDGSWLLLGGEGPAGPTAAAALRDPRTQRVTLLAAMLRQARAWHTATLLPDGTVLVVGGLGAGGQVVPVVESFNPAGPAVEALPAAGLVPRARHTATLLTDGRVLIAGGISAAGRTLADAQLWGAFARTTEPAPAPLGKARSGSRATLLPDGTVLVWGGVGAGGLTLGDGELFDPRLGRFTAVGAPPPQAQPLPVPPQLEASLPSHGATDVPVDSIIALRFSKPMQVETLSAATVTLAGPAGPEPAAIIPAEQGRLVFITPERPLSPGAAYTVSVNGAADADGFLLPFALIRFVTASAPHAPGASAATGAGTRPDPEDDPWEWTGATRNGKPYSRWQDLMPLLAPPGVTALAGQVLRLNGEPLADVTLRIGERAARTDSTGRFLLAGIEAGRQKLTMMGHTADRPGRAYPRFQYWLDDLAAGRTTVLPFTIWMPQVDTASAIVLPVPTSQPIVMTTSRVPGLEIRIPAGVTLRTPWGQPLRHVALAAIPRDRPPFPLPDGTKFVFTLQTYGSMVEGPGGAPAGAGVRILYPNVESLPPGARASLATYDTFGQGWHTYGAATVSPDGRQVVPDAGLDLMQVNCVYIYLGPPDEAPATAPVAWGLVAGEPVDLATGLFVLEKTDLVVQDVLPITLTRIYRPGDSRPRGFGIGASHSYQLFLVGDQTSYAWADLVLPDGGRVRYTRISPGTDYTDAVMEHTATPTVFYKSVLSWNPQAAWEIRLKDGTLYQFQTITGAGPRLKAVRDRAGNQLTITRDARWRITRIASPNGRWLDFTYDGRDGITRARDSSGRAVTYAYDAEGRLWKVTDPEGGVTEYTYDGAHRLLTIRDARGIVFLTNAYDAAGRVIRQTQADGSTYEFAYTLDGEGRVTRTEVTDPRRVLRRVAFNADGYAVTDTQAAGTPEEQTLVYARQAGSNLVLSVTDALNRQTVYSRDNRGNVTAITRLAGTEEAVTTTRTYEPTFNRVTSVTDALGHTTTFGYDGSGNLAAVTDALGATTTLSYNAQGQPLTIKDPLGHAWTFTYDGGDLATAKDPLGQVTAYFSDGAGRLAALVDPLGGRSQYDYDDSSRLIRVTDAAGGVMALAYDPNGNLTGVTDARGNRTGYTYDAMDRLATRTDPLQRGEHYGYDATGNLTGFTDRNGRSATVGYDALSRRTTAAYGDGSTTTYAWDAGNRLSRAVDSVSGTIGWTLDGLDRVAREVTPQGTVEYGYDAAGRRTSMTVLGQPSIIYTHDAADRLTRITQAGASVTMGYDAAGRRVSLRLPNGVAASYAYDKASRITGIIFKKGRNTLGTLTYGYDLGGRRVATGGTWARPGLPQAVASATYDAANQQLTFGGLALTYDLNGNLKSNDTTTYALDARDRLIQISGPAVTASFAYDPRGRRTRKTIDGVTTDFLYDGDNPVQELSGGGVVASLLTGPAVDEYFTRSDGAGTRSLLRDALGSILALADSAGTVQTEYAYEPFGAASAAGATSANPFQFTGRENDGTDLYYYRARYYDPGRGRFLNEDPIHSPLFNVSRCLIDSPPGPGRYLEVNGSLGPLLMFQPFSVAALIPNSRLLHLYAYAGNDPISQIDPLGLRAEPQEAGCDLLSGLPGSLGGFFRSRCAVGCCNAHDRCFQLAVSWCDQFTWLELLHPVLRWRRPDCQFCNVTVVGCMARCAVQGGRKDAP